MYGNDVIGWEWKCDRQTTGNTVNAIDGSTQQRDGTAFTAQQCLCTLTFVG